MRQAHAGIYQLLPLGLRIQEKLERLIERHMKQLGASKLSLSTVSSEELWQKTGRLASSNSELFHLQDRKGAKYLLSPTHEEEITSLVGGLVKSYKELPLRLYQISRKYRDEPRPRQGLLRTREFLMKDLYTFDSTPESALETYETVRDVYSAFFDELKIPYLVARAASGEIGGDLSHEYHFPTLKGEDNIISCDSCDYVANEELAESTGSFRKPIGIELEERSTNELSAFVSDSQNRGGMYKQWFGVTVNRNTLIQAIYPSKEGILAAGGNTLKEAHINTRAMKALFPDLDLSVEDALQAFGKQIVESAGSVHGEAPFTPRILRVYDGMIASPSESTAKTVREIPSHLIIAGTTFPVKEVERPLNSRQDLVRIGHGDKCAKCEDGKLEVQSAVELGHTFYLGTRYSQPLEATVATDPSQRPGPKSDTAEVQSDRVPMQMGCHGIGVSRLIAAVADVLADAKGLNWPRVMAPFEVVVVPTKQMESEARQVYDLLSNKEGLGVDTVLDDRQREFGWKLKDADMIGYPVIVIMGRKWGDEERACEVQCRRLGVKEDVPAAGLYDFVTKLLGNL